MEARSAGGREVRTLPTMLAAMAAGVGEATIRKWASRGKLTRYGSPGRAEYDVEELLKLASGLPHHPSAHRAKSTRPK